MIYLDYQIKDLYLKFGDKKSLIFSNSNLNKLLAIFIQIKFINIIFFRRLFSIF